jgi:hypothetical protein
LAKDNELATKVREAIALDKRKEVDELYLDRLQLYTEAIVDHFLFFHPIL